MCAFTCSSLPFPTVPSMRSQTVVGASRSSRPFPRHATSSLFARSRCPRSVSPVSYPSVDGWYSGASCTGSGCHRLRSLGSRCLHAELRAIGSESTTDRKQPVRHHEVRRGTDRAHRILREHHPLACACRCRCVDDASLYLRSADFTLHGEGAVRRRQHGGSSSSQYEFACSSIHQSIEGSAELGIAASIYGRRITWRNGDDGRTDYRNSEPMCSRWCRALALRAQQHFSSCGRKSRQRGVN